MRDQRSGPADVLSAPQCLENPPQGRESEGQADVAETVLSGRDAGIVRRPGPGAVGPPQIRVVLDEQDGDGDEQKTRPREEPLHGGGRVGIRQDDQDHHDIRHGPGPPPEGHVGVVGPEDAYGAVQEEQENRSIRSQERPGAAPSREEHHRTGRQKPGQDEPIEGVPLE